MAKPKSLRMSVTQAASHTRVPAGGVIMAPPALSTALQQLDLDVAADADHNPARKPECRYATPRSLAPPLPQLGLIRIGTRPLSTSSRSIAAAGSWRRQVNRWPGAIPCARATVFCRPTSGRVVQRRSTKNDRAEALTLNAFHCVRIARWARWSRSAWSNSASLFQHWPDQFRPNPAFTITLKTLSALRPMVY